MKQTIILLISILLIFSLFACKSDTVHTDSDVIETSSYNDAVSENENTKKLVSKEITKNDTGKTVQTNEYEYDSFGRTSVVKTTTEKGVVYNHISYDKNGYEIEYITKNEKGEIQSHHQYERYEDGYIKIWRTLDKNGNVLNEQKVDLEYDEQGRVLKVFTDGELSQYYSYDENGNATERRPNTDSYNVYDKNDNRLESHNGDSHMYWSYENGKLIEVKQTAGGKTYITAFEYDDELLLSQTNYENDEVTRKEVYEYDTDGDVIKQTTENALGIATSIVTYEYAEFIIEK